MAMFYCQKDISFLLLLLAVCTTGQPGLLCGVMDDPPVKSCNLFFKTPVCHAVYVYRRYNGNFSGNSGFSLSLEECQSEEHCASSQSNCILELISWYNESFAEYSCCCNETLCNLHSIVFPDELPTFPNTIPTIASGPSTTMSLTNTTMTVEIRLQSWIIAVIISVIIIIVLFISVTTVACCCCFKLCRQNDPVTATQLGSAENVMSLATTLLSDEILGKGSDGTVYKGWYEGEEVAVKVCRDDRQFRREMAVYKSFDAVNHKNILKFVTCDETRLRLVVALHNRGSVYTAIQRDVLSLPAFQLLAETMSSGLAFLHTSGIIHGDVRTGNILVKDNGEAAICDFGHSRKFFKEHDSDQKVQCTFLPGVYSAPELRIVSLTTRSEYKAADCFSLGMVLYELLTRTQRGQEEVEAHTPLVLHNRPNIIPEKFNVFSELVALVYDLWSESPEARPKAEATHIALQNFRLSIANFRSSAPSSLASGSVSSLGIAETAF